MDNRNKSKTHPTPGLCHLNCCKKKLKTNDYRSHYCSDDFVNRYCYDGILHDPITKIRWVPLLNTACLTKKPYTTSTQCSYAILPYSLPCLFRSIVGAGIVKDSKGLWVFVFILMCIATRFN